MGGRTPQNYATCTISVRSVWIETIFSSWPLWLLWVIPHKPSSPESRPQASQTALPSPFLCLLRSVWGHAPHSFRGVCPAPAGCLVSTSH